ncbi:MAG: ribonuclease E/G [Defluviitaleaceae bacterium]|nr:ribonuclease E/G [Defluviitaleaceae bacterium]
MAHLLQKKPEKRSIVIDVSEKGVRGALLDAGTSPNVLEFAGETSGRESLVGHIFVGKVAAVHKNGFSFIDLGMDRNAFLNLNDSKHNGVRVREGQAIAVQIGRDAYKDKGASVTTALAYSGRFFVITDRCDDEHPKIGVSKKIINQAERNRLVKVTDELLEKTNLSNRNITIRTDAENAATSLLDAELTSLAAIIAETEEKAKIATPPTSIYTPYASPALKIAAELSVGSDIDEIIVNTPNDFNQLEEAYKNRGIKIKLVDGSSFYIYNISKLYENTVSRKIYLTCGGYIVIDKTEACTVIDVNSGKYEGRKDIEGMALKVNLEAAAEAARQLRLRNVGGIVIIDFIRMSDEENRQTLISELKSHLDKDPAITVVEGFTKLGLMEITRKRR